MTAKKKPDAKPAGKPEEKRPNPGSFKKGNPGGPGRGNKKPRPEDAGDWQLLADMEWVYDHPNETPQNAIQKVLQAKIKDEPWEWIKEYNALCRRLKVGNRADEAATVARESDAGEARVEETITKILREIAA